MKSRISFFCEHFFALAHNVWLSSTLLCVKIRQLFPRTEDVFITCMRLVIFDIMHTLFGTRFAAEIIYYIVVWTAERVKVMTKTTQLCRRYVCPVQSGTSILGLGCRRDRRQIFQNDNNEGRTIIRRRT